MLAITSEIPDLASYCTDLGRSARASARILATARGALKNQWLRQSADALETRTDEILAANARDVAAGGERSYVPMLTDFIGNLNGVNLKPANQP